MWLNAISQPNDALSDQSNYQHFCLSCISIQLDTVWAVGHATAKSSVLSPDLVMTSSSVLKFLTLCQNAAKRGQKDQVLRGNRDALRTVDERDTKILGSKRSRMFIEVRRKVVQRESIARIPLSSELAKKQSI